MSDCWNTGWPLHLALSPECQERFTGHPLANGGNPGHVDQERFEYSQSAQSGLVFQVVRSDLHGHVDPMLDLSFSQKDIRYTCPPGLIYEIATAHHSAPVHGQAVDTTISGFRVGGCDEECKPVSSSHPPPIAIAGFLAETETLNGRKRGARPQQRARSHRNRQLR